MDFSKQNFPLKPTFEVSSPYKNADLTLFHFQKLVSSKNLALILIHIAEKQHFRAYLILLHLLGGKYTIAFTFGLIFFEVNKMQRCTFKLCRILRQHTLGLF